MNKRLSTLWLAGIAVAHLAWMLFGPEVGAGTMLAVQTVVSGTRATAGTDGILAQRRVDDMSDTIHLLDPNEAPLTAITMKLNSHKTINPEFQWLLDDYLPSSDTTDTTTYTAGDLAITVATSGGGAYFRSGDLLKVLSTGEVLFVESVSGDVLTVVRSVGDTTYAGSTDAAAINPGSTLLIIGNANYEGSLKREVKTTKSTLVKNFTQIFRWPWGATETEINSELFGGNDMNYQERKAGIEYRIQLERASLFGEASEYTSAALFPGQVTGGIGDKAIRTTGGIAQYIGSGTTTSTSTLTRAVTEAFLRTGMRYGPARKMLFASRQVMSWISQLATDSTIQTIPTDTSFPLALTEWVSPHGKMYLVTHNLLEGTGANNQAYQGWAFLLDLDAIFYRYLQNRDTRVHRNIQANDADEQIHEYRGECGFMLIQPNNHAILNNLSTYA